MPPRFLGLRPTSFFEPLADFRKNVSSASTIPTVAIERKFQIVIARRSLRRHSRLSALGLVPEHLVQEPLALGIPQQEVLEPPGVVGAPERAPPAPRGSGFW